MTVIETLETHIPFEANPDLVEYFTPPTLHIHESDISLTGETIVPTLETLLAHDKHILLLGEPGTGKSTLLREVLREYQTSGSTNYDTVMYLPLRAFEVSNKSFIDVFQQRITRQITKPENVLWILDGMDEVRDPGLMASLIEEITNSRPEDHIIIASRSVVYEEGFFEEFSPITIAPFDSNQVKTFIQRYSDQVYGIGYLIPIPFTTQDGQHFSIPMLMEEIVQESFDKNLAIKSLLSTPVSLPYIIDILADGYLLLPNSRPDLCRDIIDNCDKHRWAQKDPQSFVSVFENPDRESYRDLYDSDKEFLASELSDISVRLAMIKFYKYIADRMMTDFHQSVLNRNDMKTVLTECFSEVYAQSVMGVETLPFDFCEQRAENFLQASDKGLPLITKLEENGYGFAHRSLFEFLVAQNIINQGHESGYIESIISFCTKNDLLFSLHGRESIRMLVELFSIRGDDEGLEKFFHTVLNNSSVQPYESMLAAASFVTPEIFMSWYGALIKEIYFTIDRAILTLKESVHLSDQKILFRLRKQQERLNKMIQEKGLYNDILAD